MKYVQFGENGEIKGVYANPQPQPDGSSLTELQPLADDHPDVVAFENRTQPSQAAVKEQRARVLSALSDADPGVARVVAILKTADLI